MLSPKQQDLIGFANEPGAVSLSVGAVRSGKTYAATAAFTLYTQQLPIPYTHLILGRKLRQIELEVLPEIEDIARSIGAPYLYTRGDQTISMGDQKYVLAAGNDETSVDRLQGITVHSVLVDEATLVPHGFFKTAVSRMTFPDSKLWAMCNPGHPLHWLKTDWIDNGMVDQHLQFTFDDNPTLSDEVKARNRRLFSGVFAKRMVEGLWAAADGLIYPQYIVEELDSVSWTIDKTVCGVDYGVATTTAMCILQRLKHRVTGVTKYHVPVSQEIIGGSDKKNKTDVELCDAILDFVEPHDVASVILDPSAASLRAEFLKRPRRPRIRKAKNDIIPGVRLTGALLAHGELTLSERCESLVGEKGEFKSYQWDDVKDDTVVKENDHSCDALRYAVMELCQRPGRTGPVPIPEGF